MKKILIMAAGMLMAFSLFANDADIQKGIEYHTLAREGKIENAQKCIDTLKPYVNSNAVACAYYGSAFTLLASAEIEEENALRSLEYLEQGCIYMDKAVELDSKNFIVHLTRLENGIEVSRTSPLKRYAVIKDDFDFLLQDSVISSVEPEVRSEILAYCALYLLDSGDLESALDMFDEAIEADSNSAGAKIAQKMLDKYSE